ncbi:major facilitator superfamily domain-containing protein [Phaeosphaeriaceae sp. PMI808]|nr:major facilitator superfamily domain-containing protein [Phaeosphaeriaceae sp. PMI808]
MDDNEQPSTTKTTTIRTTQACQRCRSLKTRCLPSAQVGICQRCTVSSKVCIWAETPRRARKQRAPSRISQVEQKIDGLVASLVNPPTKLTESSVLPSTVPEEGQGPSERVNSWSETWKEKETLPGSWLPFPTSFEPDASPSEQASEQPNTHEETDRQYHERIRTIHRFCEAEDANQPPEAMFRPSKRRDPPIEDELVQQLLQTREAEELLNVYRQMSATFPFVIVPPNMTAQQLHQDKPMLLLAILTSASWQNHGRQMSLDAIYRKELAHRTIIAPRRNLGLVQSVLVYLSWYHFVFSHKTQQIFFLHHLVIGLALDIGLHQDYQPLLTPNRPRPPPLTVQELHGRQRAFLGCYYLSSMIAAGLQKPNLLKHTSCMTEWAQSLKQAREYDSDETICHLISLRQLDDQVQDTLFSRETVNMQLSDARTLMHVRFMESQLASWKSQSEGARGQRWLLLHSVALRVPSSPETPVMADSTQLSALLSALEAGKQFLDALLSFPIEEYHFISFSEWMRLPTVIMTVCRLCMPTAAHTATGWDVKAAQDRVRLDLCLESLCYRMQQLSTYDKVKQTHPDFWYAMRFIIDLTKTWYMRRVNPALGLKNTQGCPNGHGGNVRSGPSSYALPTPSTDSNTPNFDMNLGAMDINMVRDENTDPFSMLMDADFDMEQFFDMGLWGDESYVGMGFGGGDSNLRSSVVEPIELDNIQAKQQLDEISLPPGTQNVATPQFPRGIRLVLITIGLMLSIFLAALDSTIISTAIPSITTEFGSISNIAWYGSAYIVTNASFQPSWGKAYQYFPLKTTYLLSVLVFELGNVICATAPSSELLIFGRIVAGMGGGGVMTGSFISIALTAGPEYRAACFGLVGITFGTASVVGPLLGGALTDGPGWRWCFWISLPIGFTAALIMLLSFNNPLRPREVPLRQKIINLDLNGAVLISGCFSCFVFAMHWIGINPSTSARVVGSFIGFILLLAAFIYNEWAMGDKALVHSHLFKNRPLLANLVFVFFLAGAFFPLMYILPIQFQSVNDNSASQSGLRLIPLVLGISVFTMISNGLLTFWRHYKPWLLIGAILATAGNSRIYTLDSSTSTKQWIAYELITATGIGLALQMPMLANQALVTADDVPAATSLTLFVENCGTALFVAAGEAAFTNGLLSSLRENLPQINSREVLDAGATQIRHLFSGGDLDAILVSYLDGCRTGHLIPVVCAAIAAFISFSNAGPAAVREFRLRMKKTHEG